MARRTSPIEPFAAFYELHAPRVLVWLVRACGDPEAALDLTAEAFAQAFHGRAKFRGTTEEEARAWLNTIAYRQLQQYLRTGYAQRDAIHRLRLERPTLSAAESELLQGVADDSAESDVVHALEQVSEELQAATRLRVVDELPYAAVAQQLSISEPAARMRVSRALTAMREHLEPGFQRGPR